MFFNKLKKKLLKRDLRAVSVLAGGTAIAQLITILMLPFLTRIYSPESFSTLAVFAAASGIISVIGCFRFEMVIPMPESKSEGFSVLIAALFLSFIVSVVIFLLLIICNVFFHEYYNKSFLYEYIFLLPISIWMASSSLALQYWLSREKRFNIISKSKVGRAISGSLVQLLCGWGGVYSLGLIIGHIIISGAGVIRQSYNIVKTDFKLIKRINLKSVYNVSLEYKRFAFYSSLGALFNSVGAHVPILIIAAFAVNSEAGFLMLATRVVSSPISLIGSSVSQVFISNAAKENRSGALGELAKSNISGLIKVGVGPLLFLASIAPLVFKILFGNEWVRAGEIVVWMTPWIIMQYLSAPISSSLQIIRKESLTFYLQFCGFIFRTGSVMLAAIYSPMFIVEVYSLSSFLFYFIYFSVIINQINLNYSEVLICFKKSLLIIFSWIILSLIIHLIFFLFTGDV